MAQYLPVLLVSVSAVSVPAPDDSSLDTQAINQVDYLSHNWQEEDVAKSWRNMTRRKDSIQNGARLENASWRTWWKQRNRLPTVSPETLNWLKDSDVTWLYGPLHTAAEWAPRPRQLPSSEPGSYQLSASPELASAPSDPGKRIQTLRSNSPWALKPILKHRSISELLSKSFSATPNLDPTENDDESPYPSRSSSILQDRKRQEIDPENRRKYPKLKHAKSDTNVHRRNPFRGDSPPLPLIPEKSVPSSPRSESPPSSQDITSESSGCNQQKRHISFNTFVEQCIAIEKPGKLKDGLYGDEEEDEEDFGLEDDGYREDDEDEDDYDSDDDILRMRSSSRSHTPIRRRVPLLSTTSNSSYNGYDMSTVSSDREHVTIAPIAPTILKASASPSPSSTYHSHIWEEDEMEEEEALFATRPSFRSTSVFDLDRKDNVNLVFAPPQGSIYAERLAASSPKAMANAVGFPTSPPKASASLRSASFDDAGLLKEENKDDSVDVDPSLGTNLDLLDRTSMEDYLAYRATMRSSTHFHNTLSEDVRSTRSRSSSGSASEDGTVVPPLPSSSRTLKPSQSNSKGVSPVRGGSPAHLSRSHIHVNQSPSPSPSTVSTGTSTTASTSSGSGHSTGSPLLEPPFRGRSTSPITSASPPKGEETRGRTSRRGSSNSLSEERDPPRGRSRSRSIGASSPLNGSVSPRSDMGRRASMDGGGLGGFGSSSWREASLSPEDYDVGRRGGRWTRGRRSASDKSGQGSSSSSSLSPPGAQEKDTLPIPVPSVSHAVLPPQDIREPVASPDLTSSKNAMSSATTDAISKPVDIPNKTPAPNPVPVANVLVPPKAMKPEELTMVGRAVSSAKGYLGAFWSSTTTAQSQAT